MTDTALAAKKSLHITTADAGDITFKWDPADEREVSVARKAFADAKDKGYFAYVLKTDEDGEPANEIIKEFDPEATKIVMTPQLVGG